MPIINFQPEFVEKIKVNQKTMTIKKSRKRQIKQGCTLHLYVGLRTKQARKIKEVKCKSIKRITIIPPSNNSALHIFLNSKPLGDVFEILNFIKKDGFDNPYEFLNFFEKTYGLPFSGVLIQW